MKITINRSVEMRLRPTLNRIDKNDIWYPLYGEQGEPVFSGKNKYREFYGDLDRYVNFRGKTVIDLGCNLGHYSFLAARLGAARVVGLDINKNLIHACNILRDYLGISQAEFKTSDFLYTIPDSCYDVVLLIDYIGKNVIKKFKLKQVLVAAESRSRKEILFTLHQAYKISGKLRTSEENLIPYYTADFVRDGKFQVLDYVKHHFSGKGRIKVFKPKNCDRLGLKQPVHFRRTEVDPAAVC